MKQAHSFDDVLLVPKHSDIESRFSVKIGNDLDKNIYLDPNFPRHCDEKFWNNGNSFFANSIF